MTDTTANPLTDDDEDPPAATVDLTADDAVRALETDRAHRHAELDEAAQLFQAADVVVGTATGARHGLPTDEVAWDDAVAANKTLTEDIVDYVLEHHDHAVRWTLDPYDEMDEQPADDTGGD